MFLLDRDGTLTLSDLKLPGVDAFLARLRATGRDFLVVTNNSSKSPARHHANFRRMGLDVEPRNVLVSIEPALAHLRAEGRTRLHLVANAEVAAWTAAQGFDPDAPDPQALLLTYDTELTYAKLERAVRLLRSGVPFYATHVDVVCPTPDGPVPDIGTFLRAIEMTTGMRPLRTFGKPAHDLVRRALAERGLKFGDAVVVGDRLYTDIAMAEGTEMASVLVLTGETTLEAYRAQTEHRADAVVPDLGALLPWL
jgi:NagD protein